MLGLHLLHGDLGHVNGQGVGPLVVGATAHRLVGPVKSVGQGVGQDQPEMTDVGLAVTGQPGQVVVPDVTRLAEGEAPLTQANSTLTRLEAARKDLEAVVSYERYGRRKRTD